MASRKKNERGRKGVKSERKEWLAEKDLGGFNYLKRLGKLRERLEEEARERDRAGDRQLFYDQYAALLLFYFSIQCWRACAPCSGTLS